MGKEPGAPPICTRTDLPLDQHRDVDLDIQLELNNPSESWNSFMFCLRQAFPDSQEEKGPTAGHVLLL